MKQLRILITSIAVFAAGASVSHANVWIDESFDGAGTFVEGNGNGPAGATLDTYDSDGITSPIVNVMTHTGTLTTARFYNGTTSYQLAPGQAITVGQPYENQSNGNFLLLQMAVSVSPIPAAGTVGEIRWNTTDGGTNYSWYTRLVSTGTAVNIIGGQDLPTTASTLSGTVDTLTSPNTWTYITMRMQKHENPKSDSRFNDGLIPQGMHWYSSSNTQSLYIPLNGPGASDLTKNISISATGGTFFVDSLYYDGGQDDQASTSNPRPFNSAKKFGAGVNDWTVY